MRVLVLLFLFGLAGAVRRPKPPPTTFNGRVGACKDAELKAKREKFFKWIGKPLHCHLFVLTPLPSILEKVGGTSVGLEWRDEGVAGSGLFAIDPINQDQVIGSIPLNATLSARTLSKFP
jgi:hypothetical protein